MKSFISSYQSGRFKVINMDTISHVDFVAPDAHPNTPDRCTIHFVNGEKSISLDNATDAQRLLEAMRNHQEQGYN